MNTRACVLLHHGAEQGAEASGIMRHSMSLAMIPPPNQECLVYVDLLPTTRYKQQAKAGTTHQTGGRTCNRTKMNNSVQGQVPGCRSARAIGVRQIELMISFAL